MKSLHFIFKASLAFMFASALGLAQAQTKWDLASAYPVSNFHTQNLQALAADIEKATNGKLKIVVHPNGSLFPANGIKRAVQTGQAQMGELLVSSLANENPIFGVDSIPFLATSYKEAAKLWALSKGPIEKALQKQGIKVLYAVPWPPQGLYSKNPITSGTDLKGLKWRAYNPATSKIAELVGAQYYYEIDAWLPNNILMVNQKDFDSLDKPTQAILVKLSAEAQKRGWEVSEKKNKSDKETLAKNGMIVGPPSPALKNDLDRVGRIMVAEWIRSAGEEGQQIITAFKK